MLPPKLWSSWKTACFTPFLWPAPAPVAAVRAMAAAGADLVELGIPFSDPTAEGPVIQEANLRALTAGTTTDKVFDLVRDLRRDVTIPFVFMSYANVVFSYGAERFLSTCAEIGVDGLILPDLPFEEKEEFLPLCRQCGVNLISMIAPTSENRIAMIAKEAEGFLYVVSSLGVTGTRSEIKTDLASIVDVVRRNTAIPCAIRLRHFHARAGSPHGLHCGWCHCGFGHREADDPIRQRGPGPRGRICAPDEAGPVTFRLSRSVPFPHGGHSDPISKKTNAKPGPELRCCAVRGRAVFS